MKERINRIDWKPQKIDKLAKLPQHCQIVDQYPTLLEELFLLRNPRYRFDKNYAHELEKFILNVGHGKKIDQHGNWYFYPWLNTAIHFLPEKMHLELRTGRNRNLINEAEQNTYYNSHIGIMGMSVGSHVALTIVMTGGAKYITLADLDEISGSNLNRIRTGYQNVGLNKAIMVARQIMEINPYAVINLYTEGVSEKNISKIIAGKQKLDVLVEEMDNPFFKLLAREVARKNGVPVIMAADNADGIIVDIERYDTNSKLPLLHGLVGNITANQLKLVNPQDLPRVIAKMAGANLSTVRMLESVLEVGKTLYSWPQLGNAATLCGSVLAFLSKQIVLGAKLRSGRYNIDIPSMFDGSGIKLTQKPQKREIKKLLERLKL